MAGPADTWTEPEPDGVYRLEPARALHLRVVDADGREFAAERPILRDATGREFAVAGEAAANLRLDQVPLGELTAIVRPAGGGESRTFTIPAAVTEWTLVWR